EMRMGEGPPVYRPTQRSTWCQWKHRCAGAVQAPASTVCRERAGDDEDAKAFRRRVARTASAVAADWFPRGLSVRERGLGFGVEASLRAARPELHANDERLVVERARAREIPALQTDRPFRRRLLAGPEFELLHGRAGTAAPAVLAAPRVHEDP